MYSSILHRLLDGTARLIEVNTIVILALLKAIPHFREIVRKLFLFNTNNAKLTHARRINNTSSTGQVIHFGKSSGMQALREKCSDTGTLLILDEIQAGFGRTGTLWGFEAFDIVPDILMLGKALGGGLPLGAFISSKANMDMLTHQPVLGHITTFGGHPLSCAAGKAAMQALLEEQMMVLLKKKFFIPMDRGGSFVPAEEKTLQYFYIVIAGTKVQ